MSNRRKLIYAAVGIVILGFLVIQFIPVPARANPPVKSEIQWNSPETESLIRGTCYDCHSDETSWPWYSYIAPISWFIAKDVDEGREVLNFSEQNASDIASEEPIEEIEEGAMPPSSYLMLHPDANLSDSEKAELIAGLRASLHGTEEGERGEGNENHEDGEDDD